jgi:hypothetical protein
MTDQEGIFRREAVELHARGKDDTNGVVRIGRPWLARLYVVTVLLFVTGLVALWVVPIQETASGPAVIDAGTGSVVALVPAGTAPDLDRAQELRVEVPGRDDAVTVEVSRAAPADDAAIRRAGMEPPAQGGGILLSGRLSDASALRPATEGGIFRVRATLLLRSEPLAGLLGRQVRTMFGDSEADR